ncbi:hypothetical protein Hanom_Chr16g01452291 [Helianthus anomalus]
MLQICQMNVPCVTPKLVYFLKKYLLGAFLIFLPKTLKNMYITCVNFFKKKKKNIGSFEFPGFSKLKWVFYRYLHYIYIYTKVVGPCLIWVCIC